MDPIKNARLSVGWSAGSAAANRGLLWEFWIAGSLSCFLQALDAAMEVAISAQPNMPVDKMILPLTIVVWQGAGLCHQDSGNCTYCYCVDTEGEGEGSIRYKRRRRRGRKINCIIHCASRPISWSSNGEELYNLHAPVALCCWSACCGNERQK